MAKRAVAGVAELQNGRDENRKPRPHFPVILDLRWWFFSVTTPDKRMKFPLQKLSQLHYNTINFHNITSTSFYFYPLPRRLAESQAGITGKLVARGRVKTELPQGTVCEQRTSRELTHFLPPARSGGWQARSRR